MFFPKCGYCKNNQILDYYYDPQACDFYFILDIKPEMPRINSATRYFSLSYQKVVLVIFSSDSHRLWAGSQQQKALIFVQQYAT